MRRDRDVVDDKSVLRRGSWCSHVGRQFTLSSPLKRKRVGPLFNALGPDRTVLRRLKLTQPARGRSDPFLAVQQKIRRGVSRGRPMPLMTSLKDPRVTHWAWGGSCRLAIGENLYRDQ